MPVPLRSNEFERHQLVRNTEEIKRHYDSFLANLQQYILTLQRDGALSASVVKSQIIAFDKKLKTPIGHCESLEDIFEILSSPEHSSFLDYELIKLLADYGNDKIRSEFIEYKKKLQKFLESRMIAVEPCVIVIDESITSEIKDVVQLQNRVKIILGHKNLTLLHLQPTGKRVSLSVFIE